MISAISWVPKGALKSVPVEADPPSKEVIEEILKNSVEGIIGDDEDEDEDDEEVIDADTSNQDDDVAQALAAAGALGKGSVGKDLDTDSMANALKELNMDDYDDEDDGIELFDSASGIQNVYYPSNDMDLYLKDKGYDSEELDDITIKAEDSVTICARNEDDFSHLEVWILEESESDSNMYIHHDIIIPAFPLCMAWLDCPVNGGEKGNFIAVGSMEPAIEIWDLDMMDKVQPSAILGGIIEMKKKKGKKKSMKYKEDSHTDALLGLAWNKEYRNILASASADQMVKIWDVATGQCSITMDHHTDKVQAVAWNHFSPQVLLSGSFDDTVVLKDGRKPSHTGLTWQLTADVESLAWDPHSEHSFVVSVEDGMVSGFDVRGSESKPTFTLHAHDQAVCSVSYNPLIPNLLAIGSKDKWVKLWDLSNNQPSCVTSKNPKAGAVFSVSFSKDSPFLLGVGGSKGKLEDLITIAIYSQKILFVGFVIGGCNLRKIC